MTCTLLLMRHSHAVSENECRDFERPLTDDGIQLAESTGRLLNELELTPDLIITSAALRTVETGRCVADQYKPAVPRIAREDLYHAQAGSWLPAIQAEASPDSSTILAIGHNPAIGLLIAHLARRQFAVSPATVGVYSIDAPDWFQLPILGSHNSTLTHLIVEGQLESID